MVREPGLFLGVEGLGGCGLGFRAGFTVLLRLS